MEAVQITLVMLVAITALGAVARRIAVPYPILLVLGGPAVALIPGLPEAKLDPARLRGLARQDSRVTR